MLNRIENLLTKKALPDLTGSALFIAKLFYEKLFVI